MKTQEYRKEKQIKKKKKREENDNQDGLSTNIHPEADEGGERPKKE